MIDLYTKAVLTVIAAALVAIVARDLVGGAGAGHKITHTRFPCGEYGNPCHVAPDYSPESGFGWCGERKNPCYIKIDR